jgi:hypothetical protein
MLGSLMRRGPEVVFRSAKGFEATVFEHPMAIRRRCHDFGRAGPQGSRPFAERKATIGSCGRESRITKARASDCYSPRVARVCEAVCHATGLRFRRTAKAPTAIAGPSNVSVPGSGTLDRVPE